MSVLHINLNLCCATLSISFVNMKYNLITHISKCSLLYRGNSPLASYFLFCLSHGRNAMPTVWFWYIRTPLPIPIKIHLLRSVFHLSSLQDNTPLNVIILFLRCSKCEWLTPQLTKIKVHDGRQQQIICKTI